MRLQMGVSRLKPGDLRFMGVSRLKPGDLRFMGVSRLKPGDLRFMGVSRLKPGDLRAGEDWRPTGRRRLETYGRAEAGKSKPWLYKSFRMKYRAPPGG